jgi:hypothetical protein
LLEEAFRVRNEDVVLTEPSRVLPEPVRRQLAALEIVGCQESFSKLAGQAGSTFLNNALWCATGSAVWVGAPVLEFAPEHLHCPGCFLSLVEQAPTGIAACIGWACRHCCEHLPGTVRRLACPGTCGISVCQSCTAAMRTTAVDDDGADSTPTHFVDPLPLLKARTDAACALLLSRLPSHLIQRGIGRDKHDNAVLKFFVTNLNRGVAELVRRGCIRDLPRGTSTECLLADPDRFVVIEKAQAANQGCYLFYDTQMHTWIRSGKACGIDADFISRLDQHVAGASAGGSYFYDCYPSSALPVRGNTEDVCMGSQAKVAAFDSLRGPRLWSIKCSRARACVRASCVRVRCRTVVPG